MCSSIQETVLNNIDEEGLIDFARKLVMTPSETFGEAFRSRGDEREVAGLIDSRLREIGFANKMYAKDEKRPNVVAELSHDKDGPILLFSGHMDTVPIGSPEKWKHDPLQGEIVDGRLYGRGAVDMKSGLAAMIAGAEAIQRSKVRLGGKLVIAAVADEEGGGQLGTEFLAKSGVLKANAAIISEPSDLAITIAHRGSLCLSITTKGRAAHASRPELGVNAVEKMARILVSMKEAPVKFRHTRHPLLGSPSVAVTNISGGSKVNVIPDSCNAALDIRVVPGQTREEVTSEVEAYIASLKRLDPEIEADAACIVWVEPAEISPDEPIVAIARDAVRSVTGKEPKIGGERGSADARFLVNNLGIPTIAALGPGNPVLCHVVDEYVEIQRLIDAARIYALIALNYLGSHSP